MKDATPLLPMIYGNCSQRRRQARAGKVWKVRLWRLSTDQGYWTVTKARLKRTNS